jgi:hypothetical protein
VCNGRRIQFNVDGTYEDLGPGHLPGGRLPTHPVGHLG